MYSGWAEAYGLLAALTFLHYYWACYDMPIPPTMINCFCNNIDEINSLTDMQTNKILHPNNDTTNNDHELYLTITAVANQCQLLSFQYLHVKGHQDKDPNWPLTVTEQHNVDCNKQAKQYVQSHKCIISQVAEHHLEQPRIWGCSISPQNQWESHLLPVYFILMTGRSYPRLLGLSV